MGGVEWTPGCEFDRDLWLKAGSPEVLIVPTAAAYEHPERAIAQATSWFAHLGATCRALELLRREDAMRPAVVEAIRRSGFVYFAGGSPMHLRSVLKDSPALDALVERWRHGAVVAGSSAGAMALCDPMVDPRGGALTLGLGLLRNLAVVPHADTWSPEKVRRTLRLATGHLRIAAIDERTALIREPEGTWRASGKGQVRVYLDGDIAGLEVLAGVELGPGA